MCATLYALLIFRPVFRIILLRRRYFSVYLTVEKSSFFFLANPLDVLFSLHANILFFRGLNGLPGLNRRTVLYSSSFYSSSKRSVIMNRNKHISVIFFFFFFFAETFNSIRSATKAIKPIMIYFLSFCVAKKKKKENFAAGNAKHVKIENSCVDVRIAGSFEVRVRSARQEKKNNAHV